MPFHLHGHQKKVSIAFQALSNASFPHLLTNCKHAHREQSGCQQWTGKHENHKVKERASGICQIFVCACVLSYNNAELLLAYYNGDKWMFNIRNI